MNSDAASAAGARPGPKADADSQDAEETAWIDRARRGDRRAFEALYRRYAGRTYAMCLRMTGNEATAQDCLQEAFVKAWSKLDRFESRSRFGTWLHRIAVNEVLDQQRRDARHETDDLEDVQVAAPLQLGSRAEDIALERAIATLPEGARNVLVLSGLHGYSHEETGAMLGIAVGTCKAQLHRARKLLSERLAAG
ncbi:MAG: RNA polymerase sigma factor [Pseudomonadales bacterium]|nr:RNA polymerase sigma factor [Pseudomonadales bacterium]